VCGLLAWRFGKTQAEQAGQRMRIGALIVSAAGVCLMLLSVTALA
jgi:hypothetical protein